MSQNEAETITIMQAFAFAEALKNTLALDFGAVLGALIEQALVDFDEASSAFKSSAARFVDKKASRPSVE